MKTSAVTMKALLQIIEELTVVMKKLEVRIRELQSRLNRDSGNHLNNNQRLYRRENDCLYNLFL